MGDFGIGYQRRGEHTVCVAGAWQHQRVGGEHHRRGDVGKLLLLVLPRCAEIALEVWVLLQLRVGVRGQYFAVGIDIDVLVLGLLQQQLQVVEIMAGDDDERSLLYRQRNGHGRGRAVGLGVGLVQQRYALEVFLAHLHDVGQQLVLQQRYVYDEGAKLFKVNSWGHLRFGSLHLFLSESMADTRVEVRFAENEKFSIIYRNYIIATVDAVEGKLLNRHIRRL